MGLFECFTQPRKSKHEIELKAAYSYLHKKCEKYRFNPTLAVVCGSGLSKLNESSNVFFEIKYCDVPHMPVSTGMYFYCSFVNIINNNSSWT